MKLIRFLIALALAGPLCPFLAPVRASVAATTARISYTIGALPATLPVTYPFNFTTGSYDLIVYDGGATNSANSPPTVLTYASDYTVTGGGYNTLNQLQTGNVVIVAGGASNVQVGDVITILRNTPFTQTTTFSSTGFMTPLMIEAGFDKLTTQTQQLKDLIGLSLSFQPNETLSPLLQLSARKNMALQFGSAGAISYFTPSSGGGGGSGVSSITGTANQITASAATGAVTLSLPATVVVATSVSAPRLISTIATGTAPFSVTSTTNVANLNASTLNGNTFADTGASGIGSGTPRVGVFSTLGVNGVPLVSNDLSINHSLPGGSSRPSVEISGAITAPGATLLFPNGYRDTTAFTASTATDAYASYDANPQLLGTVGLNHFYGFQSRLSYGGSNTLGVMAGYQCSMTAAAGTVTEMRAYYVPDQTNIASTVTHFAGLYMDQLSIGTTRHAIYLAGNDKVFMAGGQICSSALLAPITTTSILDLTFDQTVGTQVGVNIKNKNVTNTGTYVNFYNSSTVVQGSITQTNSTTTAYNTASDARLKDNIRPLTDSGVLIDAMQPRTFNWRWQGTDTSNRFHGFIAQELNEVYPEAVTKGETWSVDYSKLTPVLTAEVKTLRSRVAVLERNQALMVFGLMALGVFQIVTTLRRKSA